MFKSIIKTLIISLVALMVLGFFTILYTMAKFTPTKTPSQVGTATADITSVNVAPSVSLIELNLSDGNYISGKDFKAGTYTITAVSGSGNVYSDNLMGGINAMMAQEKTDLYENEYKNIELPKGTKLIIKNGLTVQLKEVHR